MRGTVEHKRVLFLFSHLHKGGMQRAVSRISFCLPDEWGQFIAYFGTEHPGYKYKGEQIDFNVSGGDNNFFRKLINFTKRLILLRRFIVKEHIDIVISFGEAANVLNLISRHSSKKMISIRVAVNAALADLGWIGSVYRLLAKILYPHTDFAVSVTERLAEELVQSFRIPLGKIAVIPNIYDIEEINSCAREPLPEKYLEVFRKPIILNVGSLSKQKGQDLLLRAFSLVRQNIPESQLLIVGQGPWENKLKSLSESLGISSHVIWAGFDQNPYRYMSKASIFVLTSRYEGFPNALVEAMICGCPVIAFDCWTGPREILGDGKCGLLVETGNIDRLAKEITAVLTDQALAERLLTAGKSRSLAYSAKTVGNLWIQNLNGIFNNSMSK